MYTSCLRNGTNLLGSHEFVINYSVESEVSRLVRVPNCTWGLRASLWLHSCKASTLIIRATVALQLHRLHRTPIFHQVHQFHVPLPSVIVFRL